jgi:hypothetical protein
MVGSLKHCGGQNDPNDGTASSSLDGHGWALLQPGSNRLALLAIYCWFPDLRDLGDHSASDWSKKVALKKSLLSTSKLVVQSCWPVKQKRLLRAPTCLVSWNCFPFSGAISAFSHPSADLQEMGKTSMADMERFP